jgi:hypothetical protein
MENEMKDQNVEGLKSAAEMRRIPRNACFLRGEALLGIGEKMPCEIHDIADNSARVVLQDAAEVPERFILSIPRRQVKEWVQVVRRSEKDFGVVFETFRF